MEVETIVLLVRVLLLVLLISLTAVGQDIQTLTVADFRGGMVNSLANALMQDNQALVLENYDVTPLGSLTRRKGLARFYADTGYIPSFGLASIFWLNDKHLFGVRSDYDVTGDVAGKQKVGAATKSTDGSATMADHIFYPLTALNDSSTEPESYQYAALNEEVLFASAHNELMRYRDGQFSPIVPVAPGQPLVAAIDGSGHLTGTYYYKTAFVDTATNDTSLFSAPSTAVTVYHGSVAVRFNVGAYFGTADRILLLRRATTLYGDWGIVANVLKTQVDIIDTTTTPTILSSGYAWGTSTEGRFGVMPRKPKVPTPGGLQTTVNYSTVSTASILDSNECDTVGQIWLSYRTVFIDAQGRESYASGPTVILVDSAIPGDSTFTVTLNNIPVPTVTGQIVSKRIERRVDFYFGDNFSPYFADSVLHFWYEIATQTATDTNGYADELGIREIAKVAPICNDSSETDGAGATISPDVGCPDTDSILGFKPSSIIEAGSRLWAVGHPTERNSIFYSTFGKASEWPYDKFITIPSRSGDWFLRLYWLNNTIFLFRGNSIARLNGLSFYQFQAENLVDNIGLTAPLTLIEMNGLLYFLHSSGVYQYAGGLGIEKPALSFTIKHSIDSLSEQALKSCVGAAVLDEYWMSPLNGHTYIFAPSPSPHWKAYSFGIKSVVNYDADQVATSYPSTKWEVLADNDTLYHWFRREQDTLDNGQSILASYRSKYHLEGTGRKKVMYVDIAGTGTGDTLTVTLYPNKTGLPITSKKIKLNFTDGKADRVVFDYICDNAAVGWTDNGKGQYTITGYTIGWIPWDERKL